MPSANELNRMLAGIDRRSYPAYKSLAGNYTFPGYTLWIDHVQGDPFAAPSALHIEVNSAAAGFPSELYHKQHRKIALEDALLRRFGKELAAFSYEAHGSGKSGLLTVSRPGQEVLQRTACEIRDGKVLLRFSCGFPANGRTINAGALSRILFQFLPACVEKALRWKNLPQKEIINASELADDRQAVREQLAPNGLVAFIADGAVLPRESGASDRPMRQAVLFHAPESLAVTLNLPHRGKVRGMGIRRGVTLIAGGGYHGKSTLLKAIERGVYDHIGGDGRELVITDETALKIRAEDGRRISNADISLFIRNLPNGHDTSCFSTEDASGSTSQAAAVIEGLEAGSRVLLMDEDTSATNFMLRDELMQKVIARDKEPITPFLERVRDLYEREGISTILVVGSCGSYFYAADTILQMDCYRPLDITESTREILKKEAGHAPVIEAPSFHLPQKPHKLALSRTSDTEARRSYRSGQETGRERLKLRTNGTDTISIGKETVDVRYLEQLVDQEQTEALAYCLRYAKEHVQETGEEIQKAAEPILAKLEQEGFASICGGRMVPAGLAVPRRQELYQVLSRY